MSIPSLTNPQLNTNVNDSSKTDESINQAGEVHIHASGHATINSNSGNEKAKTSVIGMFQVMAVSVICDILICGMILFNNGINSDKAEAKAVARHAEVQAQIKQVSSETSKAIDEMKEVTDKVTANAKEGTIWILRRDILNSIEKHTAEKEITSKEYKRIKDQFDYYVSIGGNHNVHERMDEFNTKVFGTQEIKMKP